MKKYLISYSSIFLILLSLNPQQNNSRMEVYFKEKSQTSDHQSRLGQQLNIAKMTKMANFIKSKINHEQNPQSFKKELQNQIFDGLKKCQDQIQNEKHRKISLKNIEDKNIKNRDVWKEIITKKLKENEKNKAKIMETRVRNLSQKRQYFQNSAKDKNNEMRKKQLTNSLKKIKQFYESETPLRNYSTMRIIKNESQMSSLSMKQKKDILQQKFEKKLNEIKQKKRILEMPQKQQSSLNLACSQPRISNKEKIFDMAVNDVVSDMKKIEKARKKKERQIKAQILKKQQRQKYMSQKVSDRRKEIQKKDATKKKQIIKMINQKCGKIINFQQNKAQSYLNSQMSYSSFDVNHQNHQEETFKGRNDRKDKSYRKQIQQAICEYISKEKFNLRKKQDIQ